jgi:lipoate-protein ligase A
MRRRSAGSSTCTSATSARATCRPSRRICHAAAAISALGVDARYRPRNDIEVGGRKISGTGGAFDGNALLYQGTLLIDFDVEKMLRVLRIPAEKLSDKAIASARDRVTNLKELLGRQPEAAKVRQYLTEAFESEFGIEFTEGDLTLSEHRRYQAALAEIDTPDWVNLVARPRADMPILEAAQKFAGGVLRAAVTYDAVARLIRQVWFTGDIFVNPRRTIADLEAALRDLPIDRLEQRTLGFFAGRPADMLGLAPSDFVAVVRLAVGQPLLVKSR